MASTGKGTWGPSPSAKSLSGTVYVVTGSDMGPQAPGYMMSGEMRQMHKLSAWFVNNCKGEYIADWFTNQYVFDHEEDAFAFRLRFSGEIRKKHLE